MMMPSKSLVATTAVLLLQIVGCKAECRVLLNDEKDTCLAECVDQNSKGGSDIFICDKTAPWLHHYSANPEFLPATPPEGSGTHEYAVFEGNNPPCAKNGSCPGCADPAQPHLCSVFVEPETCKVTCSKHTPTSVTPTNEEVSEFEVDEQTFQIEQVSEDAASSAGRASLLYLTAIGALAGAAWAL